MGELAQLVLT